ncbi:hypothetical protein N665_2743s0002 [Sinapis alba]|nr:hypothetical protein N665_2743s0002 [Sinapis alba]
MNNETPRISHARFRPTHVELLNILRKRIERGERSSLITDNHILYETAPWLMEHVRHVSFYENEWFYFVTRKQPLTITRKADSRRPCRKVGVSGRWKTTGLTKVVDTKGVHVGSMYYASFKTNGKTQRDGKKTGWLMHEFLLDRPGFQELVLCRIRFRPGEDYAQYAPRLKPIIIGLPQQPLVETHQDQVTDQWTASRSGEAVLPIWNGGMEQNQNFGSYGQQQDLMLGHMGQYGEGFGDMVEYQNQNLGQDKTDGRNVPMMMMNQALNEEEQWDGYSGPSLAHQYFGQDMDEHQGLGTPSFQFFGESSGQQQNHILGTQATEEEKHQGFGSSALFLDQTDQYLSLNNDLLAPGELSAQHQILRQDSNSSLTQQQNQIPGQATYLSSVEQQFLESVFQSPLRGQDTGHSQVPVMMNQALEEQQHVPLSSQPYAQETGQNNTLPTVPMTTQQQQQDNTVRNLAVQQDNVPLMNPATYLPMN